MTMEQARSDFRQLILDNEDKVIRAYAPMKRRYSRMLTRIKTLVFAWIAQYDVHDMVTAQMYWDKLRQDLDAEFSSEIEVRNEDVRKLLFEIFTSTYMWTLDYEGWEATEDDKSNIEMPMFLLLFGTAWAADNLSYTDRLNKRKEDALAQVKRIVFREIAMGADSNHMWQSIYSELDKLKYRGSTQITDEAQYLSNEAVRMASTERSNGYYINEVLDYKTCEFCRGMDRKFFNWDDYAVGITAPQFHPRCRGIVIPSVR